MSFKWKQENLLAVGITKTGLNFIVIVVLFF